ncbi:MAG: hypothetical protein J0L81_13330 [Caulobacterales bacterium]|jgi:hypothetical protein|nr:hypothetical protein [Caulobacterales bacterium]
MKKFLAMGAALALAACATMPTGGVSTPSGPASIPSTPLELGDWRNATPAATLSAFQEHVSDRYGAGLALTAVSGDLRRQEFTCVAGPQNERGDPPEQVCRRTITNSGCTHTWQVHLFDNAGDGELARTRGLYDRRCGGDGLLGGPG